ncbi:hypothetical protein [Oceanirhabdus sp. W0125-5]|uniref:hypothetical protein n=1 Tax=Oceanirhabdus sp. W0125-5 TaxID=2999116 RepID=UPI0022F34195|nr:hypothetical protein [Oceanirhabdus sp. W0125-5]WBW96214.1 hypothetical protein OW730_21355 [Oceanirhabdus sp. W0125-5]
MLFFKKTKRADEKKLKISKITINGQESSNILTAEDMKNGQPVNIKIAVEINNTDTKKNKDNKKKCRFRIKL